jgi:hypothetical protein
MPGSCGEAVGHGVPAGGLPGFGRGWGERGSPWSCRIGADPHRGFGAAENSLSEAVSGLIEKGCR